MQDIYFAVDEWMSKNWQQRENFAPAHSSGLFKNLIRGDGKIWMKVDTDTVWQKNPKYIIQASDRMADRTKNRMADLQRKQEESLDALSLTRWRQIDALPDPAARIPYILAIQIVEYCSTERKSSSCRQEQPKTLERFFLVFAHNRGHISTLAVQIKINYTMAVSNICYNNIPTIDQKQTTWFFCLC